MDPEEKEKMEKRDWLAEKIQMLNTQLEGFEADVEKAVSTVYSCSFYVVPRPACCLRKRCRFYGSCTCSYRLNLSVDSSKLTKPGSM